MDEGAVGAGAGTIAFGWKGGIGTSSRIVRVESDTWTLGVLVQSNYGGRLVIDGVPVWRELSPNRNQNPNPNPNANPNQNPTAEPPTPRTSEPRDSAAGSCMIVVATDAPLDSRNLQRLAARAVFALARTGSTYSNGSGDFAIAFSTHPSLRVTDASGPQSRVLLPTDAVSPLFEGLMEATEEAVDNSLLRATDVTANGRTIRAIPIEELKALLKRHERRN